MSKGGAGKVYFVLYLAVILELLIIFIERDEAEEHLRRQQREAIAIVQTILSQLQTGAGVSSVTTRPKDNITLSDKEPESTIRVYDVLVAVGDSTAKGGGMSGDDVKELKYIVSHIGDPNIPEEDIPLDTANLTDSYFEAVLGTDHGGMLDPRQVKGASVPTGDPTAYFQLNEEMTAQEQAKGRNVKVFRVNFKPNNGQGIYRLRFESKTNQIMGVTNSKPSDGDTVRIGNVQLTVKQLKSVKKFIEKEGGGDDAQKQVLTYVDALLDPEKWSRLPVNGGSNAIDVRVVEPDLPPAADPVARINFPRDQIYWYKGAAFSNPVTVGPNPDGSWTSNLGGIRDDGNGGHILTWGAGTAGTHEIIITARNSEGKTAEDRKTLIVETPALTKEARRLPFSRATIGSKYRPETEWASTQIPPEHYLTEVKFGDKVVFERRGTQFNIKSLPDELNVGATTGDIKTTVYWLPNGNADPAGRVPILSSDPSLHSAVSSVHADGVVQPISPRYKAPVYDGEYEFTFALNGKKWDTEFEGIRASQIVGVGQTIGASGIDANCPDCAEYGFAQPRVTQIDETSWRLYIEVVDRAIVKKRARELNGRNFPIDLTINGRGGQTGVATIDMKVRLGGG